MRQIKFKVLAVLLVIIALGAFLRLVDINNNPRSFYGDELSLAYDTYSILKTGHDQKGQFLPLIFQQGGGRPGGYVYMDVPFVAVFGMAPLGVRLLSVLAGLGLIVLVFLFTRDFFSVRVALLSAALWAVLPWDIGLSRGGFEAHLALFFAFLGTYAFLKAEKNLNYYILCAVGFFLAAFTYPTYQLVGPLFVLFLMITTKRFLFILKNLKKIPIFLFALVFIFNVGLNLYLTLDLGRNDRFQTINIFSQTDTQKTIADKVNTDRSFDLLPTFISSALHNKFIENVQLIGENYVDNLFPDFLFIHGDGNPVHNPSTMGGFFIVDLILIVFGFWFIFQKDKNLGLIFLGWILIAPAATSLVSPPHALRSAFMIPPLVVLSAYGLNGLLGIRHILQRRIIIGGVVLLFLIQFIIFLDRIYFIAPDQFSGLWAYPSKMAADMAIDNKGSFNYVILSSRLPNVQYAYPVYANVEPNLVIDQNQHFTNLEGYNFQRYDNVYIGEIPGSDLNNFLKSLNGSVFYIGTMEEKNFLTNYQAFSGLDHTTAVIVDKKDRNNNFYK